MEKVSNQQYRKIIDVFNSTPLAESGSPLTSVELVKDSEHDAYFFRSLEKSGMKLNENQIKAVRQTEGPLLIIAGAGTGKTSVLVSRIGYMLTVKKIPAANILLVTYTKKAAMEMKERIGTIPGITPRMNRDIYTGTFHSIFLRILREQGDTRRVLSNEKFKQIIIKKILREMNVHDDYQPESILSLISYWKNQILRPSDLVAKSSIDRELKEIYQKYERWKEDNQYIDFDDFMIETYFLLTYEPTVLSYYQQKFQYVLVDEFQDTSYIQYELMKLLAAPQQNFCVVGDDAQTIYGFRGAESDYILNFDQEFQHTKRIILDINYRSTEAIVGLGNELIKQNKKQIEKRLKSMKPNKNVPYFSRPANGSEEAEMIVETIQESVKHGEKSYKDFAVVYRTNAVSRAIFDEFVLKKIPFVTYGSENLFYENSFVKPILDILRLSQNPNNDEAILSVAPVLYLKKEDVKKNLERISIDEILENKPCEHKLKSVIENMSRYLKSFQKTALQDKLNELDKLKDVSPQKALKLIREGSVFNYDKYLEMNKRKSLTFHKETVMEMLNELENSAKKHKTIREYLEFIDQITSLHNEMKDLRKDESADVVKLMTIHQSKGLEFDTVFLIGCIENILPHKAALNAENQEDRIQIEKNDAQQASKTEEAIEEERRLAYVAVTRAKNELYISSPSHLYQNKAEVSRFLLEALK